MLNFKQFSSMTSFGSDSGDNYFEYFQGSAPIMGAICGFLAWEAEDQSGLEEKVRFGYGEDGFFYEFMARGEGNIEKLFESKDILVFSRNEYELYSDQASFAVVSGVYESERLIGFLLLEMDAAEDFGIVLAQLFARFLESSLTKKAANALGNFREFLAIHSLVEGYSNLKERVENLKEGEPILISGSAGSGKKSLAKYIHRNRSKPGNFILINSIPENLGKLEKSLVNWEELSAPSGVLVFDKIPNLSLGQQRIFYEWIEETQFSGLIFFIDRNEKRSEIYPPFWARLERNTISLPSLDSLGKELLGSVILALFDEVKAQAGRESLDLSKHVWEKLRFSSYPGNLDELRGILSNAIWRTRGLIVGAEEIDLMSGEPPASLDLPTSDDLDLPRCIEALERQKIMLAQKLFSGNQLRMAKALKISRGSLQYKMRNLGL
ncbi:MAG: hypothetical protein JJT78_12485 [Leptospira sp.]|nr:hypothetical protein [Leptospira sp.]